jgi:phosphoglycerate kinase
MIHSMDNYDFKFKHCLIRVDFNVPLDENLNLTDDMRIQESLPSIDQIIEDGGIPIILSHLGRPKGERSRKFSLETVAKYIKKNYGYNIIFAKDCIGDATKASIQSARPGDVVMLENLRFYNEEEKNDIEFAKKLAELGDCYVNDAFGTVHRYHASIHALPLLFEERFAGKSVIYELDYLNNALSNPKSPYVAVIGGAKITGKIEVIKALIENCDTVLIGGGMMFTFLKAKGLETGRSIYETDKIPLAKELMNYAEEKGVKLLLPVDVVIADRFSNSADTRVVKVEEMPADWSGMDIGIETQKLYKKEIESAQTITWNGPMGVFEMSRFANGTRAVANSLANATAKGAMTILGGGDSAAAMKKMYLVNKVTHVTPGGGAWLDYMAGKELPGIAALDY